jgi:uncharacterized protein (TIGR02588 family)
MAAKLKAKRAHSPARQEARAQNEPWWQWLIAAAGALLILGTAGYLVYRGFAVPEAPPHVTLHVRRIDVSGDGYVAVVEARNHGAKTAAGLKVQGALRRAGESLEQSEFVLDYLPPDSVREGGLFFSNDPRGDGVDLTIAASGYHEP